MAFLLSVDSESSGGQFFKGIARRTIIIQEEGDEATGVERNM